MARGLLGEDWVGFNLETPGALQQEGTESPPSIRDQILSTMRLPALVGAEIGIVSAQWTALGLGADVTFSVEQLKGFVGPDDLPLALEDHASWKLQGDDTLVPI